MPISNEGECDGKYCTCHIVSPSDPDVTHYGFVVAVREMFHGKGTRSRDLSSFLERVNDKQTITHPEKRSSSRVTRIVVQEGRQLTDCHASVDRGEYVYILNITFTIHNEGYDADGRWTSSTDAEWIVTIGENYGLTAIETGRFWLR